MSSIRNSWAGCHKIDLKGMAVVNPADFLRIMEQHGV